MLGVFGLLMDESHTGRGVVLMGNGRVGLPGSFTQPSSVPVTASWLQGLNGGGGGGSG